MSAEPDCSPLSPGDLRDVECWCCGATNTPDRMIHLGNHPEVHLCVQCAHYAHQQAWEIEDAGKHGPAPQVRAALRSARAEVIRREWHEKPIIGGALRWLGKHLP